MTNNHQKEQSIKFIKKLKIVSQKKLCLVKKKWRRGGGGGGGGGEEGQHYYPEEGEKKAPGLENQKKKRKKKKGNVRAEEKKKIKGNPCVHAYGYFCQSRKYSSLFSFLSILERKYIGGHGKKASKPHNLFFFLPIQPNTL